jgi:hypothetical protein
MAAPVAAQRVLVGVAATIDVTIVDQNGEPADAAGVLTVDITKADGTVVVTGGATTNPSGVGNYQYALAAQSQLNLLTFVWKDGGVARVTTYVDICGGVYFSVAAARAFDTSITTTLANDAKVQAVRREVEDECERITRRAWVPRYRRKTFVGDGTGLLRTGLRDIRTIRSATIYELDGTTNTALTATQLAALRVAEWGGITRLDGDVWDAGQSIVIEVEYGRERPPSDLQHATLTRLRSRLYMEKTGIPDRATSFVLAEGGAFNLSTPGRGGAMTGIPDVDAVYADYTIKPRVSSMRISS